MKTQPNKPELNSHYRLTKKIMSKIISSQTVKWMISAYIFLSLSIFGLVMLYIELEIKQSLFLILLATITVVFCMHTLIAGIFLFSHKNPYLKSWKDWFGYYDN